MSRGSAGDGGLPQAEVLHLLGDVFAFARPRAARVVLLVLAGSLLEAAGVLMLVPIVQTLLGDGEGAGALVRDLLEGLGVASPSGRIAVLLLAFAAIVAVRFVVLMRRDADVARLRVDFVADLRERAFGSLEAVPWSDLAGRQHGRIGHALASDVDRVSGTVSVVLHGFLALVQIVVQFAVSLMLAPVIALGAAAMQAGAFLALRRLRRRAARQGVELTEADYALYNTATTYLGGIKHARAHGLEKEYATTFGAAARRVAAHLLRQERDYALSRQLAQAMVAGIGVATIAAGVFVVPVEPERLIVVLLILARLSGPFQVVQTAMQEIGYATAAYASLRALSGELRARPAVAARASGGLGRAPAIRFRGVSCALDDVQLLEGIDCEIAAGRLTALVGPSGAGKSLFCDLAIGLLTPSAGRVEVDGQVPDEAGLARLRASLAYVAQEPFLLEDSLRANLTWGCGPVSEAEIWAVLEAVGAAGPARSLAGGLDGSIRAGGTRFSGGERQRFRLARALLRRPRFLVLDEATNALDVDAEAEVLAGLRRAAADTTILMVTHRVSTLDIADHVLVLERGRLVAAGAPEAVRAAAARD